MSGGTIYELILVGVTFCVILVLIFIAIVIFSINTNRRIQIKDEQNEKRYIELAGKIKETQDLFRNEVKGVLNNFRNILK